MGTLQIGRALLECKDYECSQDDVYYPKEKLRLWLYITLTDICPAACPFCVYSAEGGSTGQHIDPEKLREVLQQIAPLVSGVSITGGEPMTDIPLVEEVIRMVGETVPPDIELDMVTNGLNIEKLPEIRGLKRVTTVHVSRHAVEDDRNAELMRWKNAPSMETLKNAFSALQDPGMIVMNCVLQEGGIRDLASVRTYLEMAAWIGAANVSFIGMFKANDYCRRNYISPATLDLSGDPKFTVWNHFHDHEYCQCLTGDYKAQSKYIRFYYRCPGKVPGPEVCRQLVYGADNLLRAGFGNATIIEL